jgi:hypothetical protein
VPFEPSINPEFLYISINFSCFIEENATIYPNSFATLNNLFKTNFTPSCLTSSDLIFGFATMYSIQQTVEFVLNKNPQATSTPFSLGL